MSAPRIDPRKRKPGGPRFAGLPGWLLGGGLLALVGALSVWGAAGVSADDVEAARRKIEQMPPEHKEELLRRYRQFMALKPGARERIRRFHRQLHADRQSQQLRATLYRYHAWLDTLPAVTRYELRDLEPAERIERIKQIMARSRREPTPEDLARLRRWVLDYAANKRREFLERIPEERREHFAELDERGQTWIAMRLLMHRWHSRGQPPTLDETDRAKIHDSLTPETRAWLDKRPAPEQGRILFNWIRRAMWAKRPGQPPEDGPPEALGEHLDRFFTEELDEDQRDRLLRMPPDEMQRELLSLFMEKKKGGPDGPKFHRGGGPPGRGPGRPGMGRPRPGGQPGPSPFHGPFRHSPDNERHKPEGAR